MRNMYGWRRVRVVVGIVAVLALIVGALGLQGEGAARQKAEQAISLNAPTSFPVDI